MNPTNITSTLVIPDLIRDLCQRHIQRHKPRIKSGVTLQKTMGIPQRKCLILNLGYYICVYLCLSVVSTSFPARAEIHPRERMSDPALEIQAQEIYKQLRCTVCQNQSIAESNADIAADLRALIRVKLQNGDRAPEIIDYIHSRYGDFVLMRPPLKPQTWFLWFAPFVVLLGGGVLCFRLIMRGNGVKS